MMAITDLLNFLKFGLTTQTVDHNPDHKIKVKEVSFLNNTTIVCSFYPYSDTSIQIKHEIGFIVAFAYSFLDDNSHAPKSIRYIAVRAFSNSNEELLYCVSSLKAAAAIANGDSLEWLKGSTFQDMSRDTRQLIAKRWISEIENTLRDVIVRVMRTKRGSGWWSAVLTSKIRGDAEKAYLNQSGTSSTDGSVLIHYTYLLSLKDVIVNDWVEFAHIFPNSNQFETWMKELNSIRRDEGHNRQITVSTLTTLEQIYKAIMGAIAQIYPDYVPAYVVEQWREQLINILNEYTAKQIQITDENIDKTIAEIEVNIQLNRNAETQVKSVIAPPGKEELHTGLLKVLANLRQSYETMISASRSENRVLICAAIEKNQEAGKAIRDYHYYYLLSEE